MFQVINIKSEPNALKKQIWFFNKPIFQIEKTNQGKTRFKIPRIKKYIFKNEHQPIFYLKYNANTVYAPWCLSKWIEIVMNMHGDFFIICDNPQTKRKILEILYFPGIEKKFIKSNRTYFKNIISNICDKYWVNAGFAHLTTFVHAKKHNIEKFWNIDADDTMFFGEPKEIAKTLLEIMEYSKQNNIDLFSYDMHFTRLKNKHWSFGITYTQNNNKIINTIKATQDKSWQLSLKNLHDIYQTYNLDWYITYLKEKNILNSKTFNIENLYFAHWGFGTPFAILRLLQILKNNTLVFPFAKAIDGFSPLYNLTIDDKEVKVFYSNNQRNKSEKYISNELTNLEMEIMKWAENNGIA